VEAHLVAASVLVGPTFDVEDPMNCERCGAKIETTNIQCYKCGWPSYTVGFDPAFGPDMTVLQITDESGTRIVDYTPVTEYVKAVEDGDTVREMELLKTLSDEQKAYALTEIAGKLRDARRLVDFLHTEKGQKAVGDVRALKALAKEAGVEIWPEIE
jgi:hypothetical protein